MQSPCSSDMHNTIDAIEDHSGSSNFCNGRTLACLNGMGSGSNGNNRHRSAQRGDALNKFRMKRKDRCINKKHHPRKLLGSLRRPFPLMSGVKNTSNLKINQEQE
ncbi:hypothetical protein Tco_1249136 [Tanacetum coccineum]